MNRVVAHPVNILRKLNVAVGSSGSPTKTPLQPRVACQGFTVCVGSLRFAAPAPAPAAGYPRVVQFSDQPTASGPTHVDVLGGTLNADGTTTYDINVTIYDPYIGIEYLDGGAGTTIDEAQAELRGSN